MEKKILILLTMLLTLAGAQKVSAQQAYAVQSDDKRTLTFYYDVLPPFFEKAYYVSSNNTDPSWSSLFYEVNWLETILLSSVNGVATNIAEIGVDGSDANSPYYNTMGAKTDRPTRGVYIQNGKKIVVK